LSTATAAKRTLEAALSQSRETVTRLNTTNESLSARALSLADDAERERGVMKKRLEGEIESLKKELGEAREEADEQRGRGQSQRIQLLDEVSGGLRDE
jgi:hypothetical protein